MADVEYRCWVTAVRAGAEPYEEKAFGAARTPSLLLATSWLRAQASLLAWRLEPDSPASAQLTTWRDDPRSQWQVSEALGAGDGVRFRVRHEETTYELAAARVGGAQEPHA
ncbi:hypothetical protein [Streptomyces sp. TLI_146]|uniref:hypothetical protein n=1 Tax=Streptomyces sp. TLI_146 TaxID=1938858 RepID=UPI000C7008CD|nr:hypothetical protein [Streptomyces sp. TLI_146]PKV86136.1 hypothetical protein BX283_3695 [Streptomyces sp. TLI_146]